VTRTTKNSIPPANKSPVKKAATKKAAKKATTKKAAKKASVTKATTKKAPTKKAATKQAVKKAATKQAVKKTSVKKAITKRATTKKTVKKAPVRNAGLTKKAGMKTAGGTATARRPRLRKARIRPMIGWREWVVLPDFSPTPIKAKVDTGAVTSAIHAFDLDIVAVGRQTIARFGIAPEQGSHAEIVPVEAPVIGFKKVRSSNGQVELRPVVATEARIGQESFEIRLTLASRDSMGFRMLLGRRAIRTRFWVDPGRSFLQPGEDIERGDVP
jgi:hypothetical protein